jgi:hypothetical protein
MLVALAAPGAVDRRALVRALVTVTRMALPLVPPDENRPDAAVDLAVQWGMGGNVDPDALDDAALDCRALVDDGDPLPPWHCVALAAAGLCDVVSGYRIKRDAMDVAFDTVLALVEAACADLPADDDMARAATAETVTDATRTVIATILRGHFPIAPFTWTGH